MILVLTLVTKEEAALSGPENNCHFMELSLQMAPPKDKNFPDRIFFQDAVAALLKHSADVNARDKNWQTPLHVAASNKAVRCAEALVPLLSNVNVSDRAGRTALHHAAFSGHVEVGGFGVAL